MSSSSTFAAVVGATGLQGITGVQAITGIQGATGVWGITGAQATTGVQGITGLTLNAGQPQNFAINPVFEMTQFQPESVPFTVAREDEQGFVGWRQAGTTGVSSGATGIFGLVKGDVRMGQVWSTGLGATGLLGVNGVNNRSSPVQVVGSHYFLTVDADRGAQSGNLIAVALKPDGSCWAWGNDQQGDLGDNGGSTALGNAGSVWAFGPAASGSLGDNEVTTNRSSPISVLGNHTFYLVDTSVAQNQVTIALKPDGSAWAWGLNANGEVGDSSTTNRSSPVSVVGGHSFINVHTGTGTRALKSDGSIWCWGAGTAGCIGDGTATAKSSPVSVIGGHSFIAMGGGPGTSPFVAALKSDGSVWTWGRGDNFGQLGEGSVLASRSSPVSVVGGHSFIALIKTGASYTAALKSDGSVWTWGNNNTGQLGDGTAALRSSPVSVVGGHSFTAIGTPAGVSGAIALKSDGSAWAWGSNCGDNSTSNRSSPVSVVGGHSFIAIGCGSLYKADGSCWVWGGNSSGAVGDNTITGRSSPVSVIGFSNITAEANAINSYLISQSLQNRSSPVSITGNHLFVQAGVFGAPGGLKNDGSVWMWGNNTNGSLGDNTTTTKSSPVSVVGGHTFWRLGGGRDSNTPNNSTVALKPDGSAWAWGLNTSGQLGDNSISNRSSPVSIVGAHQFMEIGHSAGYRNIALKADGSAWGWGHNVEGELADNSATYRSSPVSVVGAHAFMKAATGYDHTLALKKDGSAWGWGNNQFGLVGDNTATNRSSPVSVVGGHSFVDISAGYRISLGVKADGSLWTWGQNTITGALGDSTVINRSSPVSVVGPVANFVSAVAGSVNVYGIISDGFALQNSQYYGQWQRVNSAGQGAIYQVIDATPLLNQSVTFECKQRVNVGANSPNTGMSILYRTRGQQTALTPLVTAWGNPPTWAPDVFSLASTTTALTASWQDLTVTAAIPDNAVEVIVVLWPTGSMSVNDWIALAEVDLGVF